MDVGELLQQVKEGRMEIHEAEELLKKLPYEDLGYAKLDFHRKLRTGFGETVFCQGKPDAYLADIYQRIYGRELRAGYRDSMLTGEWFWQRPKLTLYFWVVTVVVGLAGLKVFKRLRPHFSDVL